MGGAWAWVGSPHQLSGEVLGRGDWRRLLSAILRYAEAALREPYRLIGQASRRVVSHMRPCPQLSQAAPASDISVRLGPAGLGAPRSGPARPARCRASAAAGEHASRNEHE